MNEYGKIQNTKDRAAILVQLVQADARVLAGALSSGFSAAVRPAEINLEQSRAELWDLLHPKEEEAPPSS